MIKIEAYIRTHKLEAVQEALEELDLPGMTVLEARGVGRSKGVSHTYRGSQYTLQLNPRLKIEVMVNDDRVDDAVKAIQRAACTEEVGDGKIALYRIEEVIRIRSGEHGETALD